MKERVPATSLDVENVISPLRRDSELSTETRKMKRRSMIYLPNILKQLQSDLNIIFLPKQLKLISFQPFSPKLATLSKNNYSQCQQYQLFLIQFSLLQYCKDKSTTVMQQEKPLSHFFGDYPSILRGLDKLKIHVATDFQQQLLEIETDMHNLIISAPEGSGKAIALVLLSVKKFINEEEGIIIFLSHSKDLSQTLHHVLSSITKIPIVNLYMQEVGQIQNKHIIIGSPLQANNLWKKEKDRIVSIAIPQVDYLFSFGYGDALELLAGSINCNKVGFKLSCSILSSEIQKFKNQWMKKSIKINYQPPVIQERQKVEQQISHFYAVGDKLTIPISLYVTLKFGLVNPKILVIVENIREVYRYALFLERCHIPAVGIYNVENPINLRFYVLQVWMNGSTNILIATKDILKDIKSNIFKQNVKKVFKGKTSFELLNMTSIITLGLGFLENDFDELFEHFQLKPFIMTFIENKQEQIAILQNLIAYQNSKFQQATVKQIPITKAQLQGFRYRVNDVWSTINNHKADLFQQLDFKKKLLRTPELKEEFESNSKEREVLVKSINDLRKKLDHVKVALSEFVPEYLVPQCLKASYQQKMKQIQAKMQEQTPASYQKVKKVMRYVNLEDQNPETTDVSRLKLISARKRWKLLHGFKLKKVNKRKEQKGIFESG